MASNTVIVRVLGNTTSLSRSLKKAQVDLAGLDRINTNIGAGFKTAAIGAAVFSAAAVGAGAAGAAALAGFPALIAGIGIAFAAQNPKVKKAFSTLKTDVMATMQGFAEPLVAPLVKTAGAMGKAFEVIAPAIKQTFAATAPLINQFNQGLIPVAKQIKPLITQAFKAGVPVLQAFGRAVTPIVKGLRGFFKALEGGNGSQAFVGFIDQLGQSFKVLLPSIGRLLAALAPIGTTILAVLVPALASMFDWISAKIGPAFEKLTGFISEHPTLFRNIGIAVIGFVVAMKVAAVSVALFNGIMGIAGVAVSVFKGIMLAVRAATIVWTNAQWALNIAMTANPIGLVIAAIVALVAIFVIAYKKSETFRNVVNKSWNAIKAATVAVWNFIKGFLKAAFNVIKVVVTTYFRIYAAIIKAVWNAIKAVTSAVWNGIKTVVSGVAKAIKAVVSAQFNAAKAVVSAVWNAIKTGTVAAWNGIKNAVSNAINGLMTLVRGIKGKVTGAFSGAATWLLDAGRNILQGLLDGIGEMVDKVQGALGAVTDKIPDWKGPKERDKKLLTPAGRVIMQGLIKGFGDEQNNIKNVLGSITALIESMFKISGPDSKKQTNEVIRSLNKQTDALRIHARKRARIYEQLAKSAEGGSAHMNARGSASNTSNGQGFNNGNTYQITVQAPVGASGTDIGRTLVKYIDEYEKAGGRRRA